MPKSETQRRTKCDDKKKAQGLRRVSVWVHHTRTEELKKKAKKLLKP